MNTLTKTQINGLRTGKRGVMLNNNIQYENKGGSNYNKISEVWKNVVNENPNELRVILLGKEYVLTANKSVSGNSTTYFCFIENEDLDKFSVSISKNPNIRGSLSIQGNEICVDNGKNDFKYICPSFVEIL